MRHIFEILITFDPFDWFWHTLQLMINIMRISSDLCLESKFNLKMRDFDILLYIKLSLLRLRIWIQFGSALVRFWLLKPKPNWTFLIQTELSKDYWNQNWTETKLIRTETEPNRIQSGSVLLLGLVSVRFHTPLIFYFHLS